MDIKKVKAYIKALYDLMFDAKCQKSSCCEEKKVVKPSKCNKQCVKSNTTLNANKKVVKVTSVRFVNQNAIKLNDRMVKPSKIKLNGKNTTIPKAWEAYKSGNFKSLEFFV